MAYSSNLFHFICRIIFFSSVSPTWSVVPLLFTWKTLLPPQTLPLPVFLRVLYYLLHYSPFIFLTCRALRTPTSRYTQMTLPSILVLAAWYYIPQTQSHCNGLTQILHYMENPIKYPQNWNYFIFLAPSLHPGPYSNQYSFVPWASAVRYLGLVLDSKLLSTWHLYTVANKATGVFCNIFPLLAEHSALSQSNKLTLSELFIRSILT
jgi:hypothetical protein